MADRLINPTVYQIYVRSFRDTTGSGEGDLQGVLQNLGHVRDLGADAIWLSPFYCSPHDDGGYDVTDHRSVDPRYGTLDDMQAIIEKAHGMGLKILVDLVFNHTSCEHPWFLAALEGDEDAARRYVFRDPKPDGTMPNNWLSYFGPPAWEWAHQRRQYYMHQFLACQPSLDLRNEEVQADHEKTCRFWCGMGVDGFRLDAVTAYLFDQSLKDNPPARPEVRAKINGPEFSPYVWQDHTYDLLPGDGYTYACKIRDWAGDGKWLVGECNTGNNSIEIVKSFTGEGRLDALYTTDTVDDGDGPEIYARILTEMAGKWTMPVWYSCHDHERVASSLGDGTPEAAKFYWTVMLAMPGPLLTFQGEELGLPQPRLEKDEVTDPFDLLYWPDGPGREGPRVPMPWAEEGPDFGFTEGRSWLPMRWTSDQSVAAQTGDGDSVLTHAKAGIATRKAEGFAHARRCEPRVDGDVLRLEIETAEGRYIAAFNFGETPVDAPEGDPVMATGVRDDRLGRWGAAVVRA